MEVRTEQDIATDDVGALRGVNGVLVSVIYYDELMNAYAGREYTYRTNLRLKLFQKVLAPTPDGNKKALVVDIDLPESAINPEWAERVKEIKEIDA